MRPETTNTMPTTPDATVTSLDTPGLVLLSTPTLMELDDVRAWLGATRRRFGPRTVVCAETPARMPDVVRRSLLAEFGAESFRGEITVRSAARTPIPRSPLESTTAQLVLYAHDPGYEPPRPGKWDTVVVPSRPEVNAHKRGHGHDHPHGEEPSERSPVVQGVWTRKRILAAVRLYDTWRREHSATESFEQFHARASAAAGARLDALRKKGLDIQLYFPPDLNDATEADWTELPPVAGSDTTLAGDVLERLLEWFTRPSDPVWMLSPHPDHASVRLAASLHRRWHQMPHPPFDAENEERSTA